MGGRDSHRGQDAYVRNRLSWTGQANTDISVSIALRADDHSSGGEWGVVCADAVILMAKWKPRSSPPFREMPAWAALSCSKNHQMLFAVFPFASSCGQETQCQQTVYQYE